MARAGFGGPTGSRWDGACRGPAATRTPGTRMAGRQGAARLPSGPARSGPPGRLRARQGPRPGAASPSAAPATASIGMQLQHSRCSCNTTDAAATQQMQLRHSRCSCNTADAAATQQMMLQHSRCSCNTADADATQQMQLQHSRCCCNTATGWGLSRVRLPALPGRSFQVCRLPLAPLRPAPTETHSPSDRRNSDPSRSESFRVDPSRSESVDRNR